MTVDWNIIEPKRLPVDKYLKLNILPVNTTKSGQYYVSLLIRNTTKIYRISNGLNERASTVDLYDTASVPDMDNLLITQTLQYWVNGKLETNRVKSIVNFLKRKNKSTFVENTNYCYLL